MTKSPVTVRVEDPMCSLKRLNMDEVDAETHKKSSLLASVSDAVPAKPLGSRLEALDCVAESIPGLDINFGEFDDEQVCQIGELLIKYEHVFSKTSAQPGVAFGVAHEIDTGRAKPFNFTPYRNAPKEREQIEVMTKEMLANKVCSPSNSPWASPVVLIPKKDGSTRFCVDYRRLNEITVRDVYPLPRIDDCLTALGGNEYFSLLDLVSGYWQIPMAEKDKAKTAFVTSNGLYEFNVLPFGLTNAPATFQRYMDKVLAGLKWQCLLVYLDDVCVYSKSFERHLLELELTFKRLTQYNLKLKPSKCQLFKREFMYLGHIVSVNAQVHSQGRSYEARTSKTDGDDIRSFITNKNSLPNLW